MEREFHAFLNYLDRDTGDAPMATLVETTSEFQVVPFPSIPGYEILEELGRGGMGVVYKALDKKLGRQVALKILLPELEQSPEKMARFQIEANAIARLQHPNIVQIFEVGEVEGRPFISLELVNGSSLAARLGKPWRAESTVKLIEQLARAIHYAHERGIIHRDLKPANILLPWSDLTDQNSGIRDQKSGIKSHRTRQNWSHAHFSDQWSITANVCPKIADFGLAKLLDEDPRKERKSWKTQVGVVLGTPPYMSPEQAAGRAQDIGPATDIHSLGMILYEMLTGRPPFQGKLVLEILEQVKSQIPPRPSKLVRGIDAELDSICLKCLQKNPRRRYSTAAALADALSHYLVKRAQLANPPVPIRARRPAAVALQIFMAFISTIGSGLTVWQIFRAVKNIRAEIGSNSEKRPVSEPGASSTSSPTALSASDANSDESKHEASRNAAMLALHRGLACCEQGDIGRGLLWLARGLQEVPANDRHLQQLIRANLAHWRNNFNALQFTFPHFGQIENVGFSSDGKIAFTLCCMRLSPADQHSEVRLWDLTTGSPIGEPIVRKELISKSALSPDGKTMVLAGPGSNVWLCDSQTGRLIGQPLCQEGEVTCLAISNNSQVVLTGSADHTARLWNMKNGQPIGAPLQHQAAVTCVAFSPDGKLAATASEDGTAALWDVTSSRSKGFLMKHPGAIRAMTFSLNGHMLLTGGDDGSARLWDAATGRPIGQPVMHADRVKAVAFSPDGLRFATGSADLTVCIWEAAIGKQVLALSHPSAVKSVQFSSDGRKLLASCMDFTAQLWDLSTGRPLGNPLSHYDKITTAVLSPDGRRIITGTQEGSAKVWEIGGGSQICPLLCHRGRISAVRFSPDGRFILTTSWDATARLWDVKTGDQIGLPMEHNGTVQAAAFSFDGRKIVTGGGAIDKTARLWDASTCRPLGPPLPHPCGLTAVGFSTDGATIITVGVDHKVRYWSTSNLNLVSKPQHGMESWDLPGNGPLKVASPDGQYFLAAGQDRTARLWDEVMGKPVGPALMHPASVSALAFAPDGRTMATGDADGAVRVWNVSEPMTGEVNQIVAWVEHATGTKIDSLSGSESEELIADGARHN
jgi:WD40 repeat protein/serine/threonine protein kinase